MEEKCIWKFVRLECGRWIVQRGAGSHVAQRPTFIPLSCNPFVIIYYPLITYNLITPFVQLVFHFVPQKSHSQAELAVENGYVEIVGRNLADEKVTKGFGDAGQKTSQ